jgi:hypothetical protein
LPAYHLHLDIRNQKRYQPASDKQTTLHFLLKIGNEAPTRRLVRRRRIGPEDISEVVSDNILTSISIWRNFSRCFALRSNFQH